MDSNAERTIKRTQEQAVASWIEYLKQIRIERLMMVLRNLDKHVFLALDYIEEAKKELSLLLTSNRGGDKGIHGFIAEIFEVNFGNADSAIRGNKPGYEWVNNNGVNDIIKNGVDIQMKFSKSGGHFGLEAVKEHLQKYPDFLKNGGKYQLPKDFYEYVKQVSEMTDQEIGRLAKGDSDGLNYSKAKWIKEFFAKEGITIDDIEPSQLNYKEVQREVAQETIARKEEDIRAVDQENREAAYFENRATFKEGVKAAGVSAVLEGGTAFALSVAAKLKQGKKLAEFTEDDWKEVGIETGKGTLKGGIRGGAIYSLTNFTPVNANVACAFVTASFGIAAQIQSFEKDNLSPEEFLINCETICLDSAISAVAALAGLALIPGPVLGAIVGSFVGNILYTSCQKIGSQQTQRIVQQYQEDVNDVIVMLDERYALCVKQLQESYACFQNFEELAFSEEVNIAFDGSIKLAMEAGVPANQILTSIEQIDDYFLS